ncbi:alpha-1,2-fucosyltransferase [Alcaligenaceae bacterium]|nr:alpha-1,2-fucosyltransferase [Alcaligenaceae bacterium]
MNGVVIRLVGGLGNQMFQYATARAISLRSDAPLLLDVSWYSGSLDRDYALSPFRIKADVLPVAPSYKNWFEYWQRWASRLTGSTSRYSYGRRVFSEETFHFDQAVLRLEAPIYLNGYFQSEKYFLDIRSVITDEFTLSAPPRFDTQLMLDRIKATDAICVHVRRGDYITNPTANAYHGVCSMDYYRKGLSVVASNMTRPHCFVFSDDPAWVRDNFETELPMTLVDIHGVSEAHEDIRLMAACQSFVIANSSLSWWAAWLGNSEEKTVVAPRQWFKNSSVKSADLVPKEWIRL